MLNRYIVSLQQVRDEPDLLKKSGGKFFGLHQAAEIIDTINHSVMNVKIPQTWVVLSDVFDMVKGSAGRTDENYWDNVKIPRFLSDSIKHIMVQCGGKIALRSSADIEDGHKTDEQQPQAPSEAKEIKKFSGAFDSHLNVKITEINDKIKSIYKSLYNDVVLNNVDDLSDLKMSIIIQEMIAKPIISGVVYSHSFEGNNNKNQDNLENLYIHYVEKDTADRLVVAQDNGKIAKEPKMYETEEGFRTWAIEDINHLPDYKALQNSVQKHFEAGNEVYQSAFKKLTFMQLKVLANHFEKMLEHPIDMEFAVTSDNQGLPVIHVLQQRPYIEKSNFRIRNIDDKKIVGYEINKSEKISGEVVIVESEHNFNNDFSHQSLPKVDDKIIIMKRRSLAEMQKLYPELSENQYNNYLAKTMMIQYELIGNEEYCKAKAIVDTSGFLYSALYGHYGNELRQNGTPFIISKKDEFQNIKHGDTLTLDMKKGEECKKRTVLNFSEMLNLKCLADKIYHH